MASLSKDKEAIALFLELSKAEEKHQASLVNLYKELSGRPFDLGFPKTSFVRNLQVRGWREACSCAKQFNGGEKGLKGDS